jgi:arginyl-tRNA synthetase
MSQILTIRQNIIDCLQQASVKAQQAGKLPQIPLPEISVEHPQKAEHGDYASSLALRLARAIGMEPIKIAKTIAEFIHTGDDIQSVSVAPPGFINFTVSDNWLAQQVDGILAAGEGYGSLKLGEGKRIQIEFVSVNPTGPLHVGHGRGAILGSTLANILGTAGFDVEKEYYINDTGNQIDAFNRSLFARYRQCFNMDAEMPAEGYFGNYMLELADEIKGEEGDRFLKLPPEQAEKGIGAIGLAKMIAAIRQDLELLGVNFDVWFSEKSLYDNGSTEGHVTAQEGRTPG